MSVGNFIKEATVSGLIGTINAVAAKQLSPTREVFSAGPTFTGSISGTVLTITSVASGVVLSGQTIYGTGLTTGTTITSLGSGLGGTGTYNISASQTISSSSMAAANVTQFAPNFSTSLTLTGTYGNTNNISVYMDASYQGGSALTSLVGQVLTFSSAIPFGVVSVFVNGGLAQTIGVPPATSVGVGQLASDTLGYFTKVSDLSANSGSALIGNGAETVASSFNALQLSSYTSLRAYIGPRNLVNVTGYLVSSTPLGVTGLFVRDDSDSTSADNGGTIIVSSTGVRWKRQITSEISVLWFGAIGNGIVDDTLSIQAAIDYANTLNNTVTVIFVAHSTYMVSALNAYNYTKINGQGATIRSNQPNTSTSVLTLPNQAGAQGFQTTSKSIIQNIIIDGNNSTLGSATVIGLSIGNHTALIIKNVGVINCYIGCKYIAAQFITFYNLKAYNNTVGVYAKSDSTAGGANSISYYDLQCVGNIIGYAQSVSGVFAPEQVYMWNPVLNGNSVSAMALMGNTQATTQLTMSGCSNEGNGAGATSFLFDGFTILRSSIYMSYAQLMFSGVIEEANVTPAFSCNNYSQLSLGEIDGYGIGGGELVRTDSTSVVSCNAQSGAIGSINNVTKFSGSLGSAYGNSFIFNSLLALPPITFITNDIRNDMTSAQIPVISDINGCSSSGRLRDSTHGAYFYAVFPSSTAGRIRITIPTTSNILILAFNIMSDKNCQIQVGTDINFGNKVVNLTAGVWTRILWNVTGVSTGSTNFLIQNTDSLAPTISVNKFHAISGPFTTELHGDINAIAAGAYNPNINILSPNDPATTIPTIGTFSIGDVIWNKVPTAGGNIGWVCTVSGNPGTWKSFGIIST